jgi:hypothetical protein
MSPDPKWLEILKASGGQSASLAVACAAFLVLTWLRWIPEPYPWMIHASVFVLVLSGMLTITSFGTAFLKSIPIHKWAVRSFHERRAARELEKYLDHLTVEERKILTYLLHHKQKDVHRCGRWRSCGHSYLAGICCTRDESRTASISRGCALRHPGPCLGYAHS